MSLHIEIEPLDTVFFRDNRPFDAGVDTVAETIFPSPLTLFGVIGSYYLNVKGISLLNFKKNGDDKLGEYDPTLTNTKLKIKGPFFKYDGELYFPPPANLWISGNNTQSHFIKPQDRKDFVWDITVPDLMSLEIPKIETAEPLTHYISMEGINHFLTMEIDNEVLEEFTRNEDDFLTKEDRYGHTLDTSSNTVAESLLYSARHLRFKDKLQHQDILKAKFMAVVEGITKSDIPDGITAIGGEGRMARIVTEEMPDKDKLVAESSDVLDKIKQNKRFLLYFLTPTIFQKGWYRDWPAEFTDSIMVGACVNKPAFISGWQKSGKGSTGKPRNLSKTVPAGSVYFFKAQKWDETRFENFYSKYHCGDSLSDFYQCAGFGTVLIGAW